MTLFMAIFCTMSCAGNTLLFMRGGNRINLAAAMLMLGCAIWLWSRLA